MTSGPKKQRVAGAGTHPMLLLTGTSGGAWRNVAAQLSKRALQSSKELHCGPVPSPPTTEPETVLLSEPDTDLADAFSRSRDSKAVVFCVSPGTWVAEVWHGQHDITSSATLDDWKASAGILLDLWRKNRARITLVDWEECLRDAGALAVLLAEVTGRPVDRAAFGGSESPSAASQTERIVGTAFAERDRVAVSLWREMLAATTPLGGKHTASWPDPAEAMHEIKSMVSEIQRSHAQSEVFLQELEQSRGECGLLREKLRLEEEAHRESLRRMEAALTELADLRANHHCEREALERVVTDLRAEQNIKLAEKSMAVERLAELGNAAAKAEQAMLQALRDALTESEGYYERWKLREASSAGGGQLQFGAIVRGLEKDERPHRQIDFTFESVSLLGRVWRTLPVRLVEHEGNPGLALFNPFGNAHAPLHHWQPDGRENGVDYMLFVVRNKKSRDRLFSCPASDLALVRELSAHILGHLIVHGQESDKRWSGLARRLIQEVDEIPERLHYDSVSATPIRRGDRELLVFNVANLYFRGGCDRNFHFDWKPDRSGGSISLQQGSDDSSLLLSQAGELGTPGAGHGMSSEPWPKLTAHDRTFLLLLAKALPDFVFHLCEQHPDQKANKERLTKQARKLYRRLRNLDRRLKLRSAIAKIIGR